MIKRFIKRLFQRQEPPKQVPGTIHAVNGVELGVIDTDGNVVKRGFIAAGSFIPSKPSSTIYKWPPDDCFTLTANLNDEQTAQIMKHFFPFDGIGRDSDML
jgi:hypothetical protein